jgi:hypothetical protein
VAAGYGRQNDSRVCHRTKLKTGSDNMKQQLILATVALSATLLLTGCLALQVGGGDKKEAPKETIGKQLIDLKTAKETGAITEAEYQAQKAKILNGK